MNAIKPEETCIIEAKALYAQNVRAYRERAGLSKFQLAAYAGTDQRQLLAIERGDPPPHTLLTMALMRSASLWGCCWPSRPRERHSRLRSISRHLIVCHRMSRRVHWVFCGCCYGWRKMKCKPARGICVRNSDAGEKIVDVNINNERERTHTRGAPVFLWVVGV